MIATVLMVLGLGVGAQADEEAAMTVTSRLVAVARAQLGAVKAAVLRQGLGELPEVAATLANRAASARARGSGAVTGAELYPKIPAGVRMGGERATLDYLARHHVSHVTSVKNSPGLAGAADNVAFEPAAWNLARGARDMGGVERLRLQAHNAAVGAAEGARVIGLSMAKGAVVGALIELPVTATVEALHVTNGRKEVGAALRDGAQAVGTVSAASAVGAGVLTALSGLGITVGAPVLVPLAVVGGVSYAWVSSRRVWDALDDETRLAVADWQSGARGAIEAAVGDLAR